MGASFTDLVRTPDVSVPWDPHGSACKCWGPRAHERTVGHVRASIYLEGAHGVLILSPVQTMVYTIHEIPIFIAMGVVGKSRPVLPALPRWRRVPSCGVKVCQSPGLAQL